MAGQDESRRPSLCVSHFDVNISILTPSFSLEELYAPLVVDGQTDPSQQRANPTVNQARNHIYEICTRTNSLPTSVVLRAVKLGSNRQRRVRGTPRLQSILRTSHRHRRPATRPTHPFYIPSIYAARATPTSLRRVTAAPAATPRTRKSSVSQYHQPP